MRPLEGKTAIVTGANRGLGLAIARSFLAAGADVALGARDAALLEEAAHALRKEFAPRRVVFYTLDVSRAEEAAGFVTFALQELGKIDVLVNNAGMYGPMGNIEDVSLESWVETINVNLLGSVNMVRSVVGHMKNRNQGRIIQISGGGATSPMPMITAYAASKAAVVRFAESMALELKDSGIYVNAIAPGVLKTQMLDQVIENGPEKVGQDYYNRMVEMRDEGAVPLEKGADLAVFLASDKSEGITGRLISAVWDNYEAWPAHKSELTRSDAYTLRRITGRDRGFGWGDK